MSSSSGSTHPDHSSGSFFAGGGPPPEHHEFTDSLRTLQPGSKVGDYRLIRRLGIGGMGQVWEALELKLQRTVALKFVRPERFHGDSIRLLEREARAGGRLSHPGIVAVYATGEADGVHYISQELIGKGRNLAQALAELHEQEVLPPHYFREVAQFVATLADAMQAAHEAGIIHRDLKPHNILITADARPKITDFGLARLEEEATQSGQGLAGTYMYMSPEQATSSSSSLDHRSDIFSLGAVLYEMLALRRAFQGDTGEQILAQVRNLDPPPPRQLRSRVPEDLSCICMKSLEKNRAHRYSSMQEFANDLRRFLRNEPIEARPPGPIRRTQKWALRHPTASTTLGVGSTALVGITILFVLTVRAKDDLQKTASALEVANTDLTTKTQELQVEKEKVEEQNESILQLSDLKDLEEARKRAGDLWPAHPELIPDLESWLRDADTLEQRLANHRRSLQRLRSTAPNATQVDVDHVPRLAANQKLWWFETLDNLVQQLVVFLDPDPAKGLRASVRGRLERARTIQHLSIDDHEEAWEDIITYIALSPLYDGLEFEPQMGLVPLGPDPETDLAEFVQLETGGIPERDAEGNLILQEESGIVLVLLPARSLWIGAQNEDPSEPNYDPNPVLRMPLERVEVSAFFLGKHEVTQAHWLRLTGRNPSFFDPADNPGKRPVTLLHPVEQVSWVEATETLQQVGLVLPNEAESEYGRRGGTLTTWWTGKEQSSLIGKENLADKTYLNTFRDARKGENWEDGFGAHAPVGSFVANAFGLFDVAGNVQEWCRDPIEENEGGEQFCVLRGADFTMVALEAGSAARFQVNPQFQSMIGGVRAARPLEPSRP